MNDNKNIDPQNEEELNIITLTDEDGQEIDFEFIGEAEIDGIVYLAIAPAGEAAMNEGIIEYGLLKVIEEDGEEVYVTIDDEDEFNKVADYFDDMFDSEEDYDA